MRAPFSEIEREQRAAIREAFVGCRIYCRREHRGVYAARIDLLTGSWCSARGNTREDAVRETFLLALEPAPGFPGWVEWPGAELEELALT